MSFQNKTSAESLEALYREKADPWNFAASEYEQGRFDAIIRALTPRRYRRAFEPGCSIGTLTERLAGICDRVDASDFSATAVARAAQRCAALPQVNVTCAALTENTCLQGYDLVIFSEIGYYFEPDTWQAMALKLADSMATGTTVLASHWLGHSQDHPQHGDQVHEILQTIPALKLEHQERRPGFRLQRFVRQ